MIKINVFARNLGWLFEDLKEQFRRLDGQGMTVLVSEEPRLDANAWVALRTGEAHMAPDLERTVACVHDLFDDPGLYTPNGGRRGVFSAGGIVLCHPDQRRLLEDAGVRLDRTAVLERPIGALTSFSPADCRNERLAIGWVGRNHWRKRIEWFIEAVEHLAQSGVEFDVVLIGAGLEDPRDTLERRGFSVRFYPRERHPIVEYPRLYRELDLLVITSMTEAGPLTLFEALASGLAVVSTPVGWAPWFSQRAPRSVRIASTPAHIAVEVGHVAANREALFQDRDRIARLVRDWSLESWLGDVIRLAMNLG
jgi:glycosyltransferase involved in cell wall biosynthesis